MMRKRFDAMLCAYTILCTLHELMYYMFFMVRRHHLIAFFGSRVLNVCACVRAVRALRFGICGCVCVRLRACVCVLRVLLAVVDSVLRPMRPMLLFFSCAVCCLFCSAWVDIIFKEVHLNVLRE